MTLLLNWLTFLVLAGGLVFRNPSLFLLGILLALVAGLSALWQRYALAGLGYRRAFGLTRLFVGEETEVTLEIVNAKPLPLAWLKIEDQWPAEVALLQGATLHYSHRPERRVLNNLLAMRLYERVQRRYRVAALHRGVLEFGPARLSSGDMFGLRVQEQELAHIDRLIVYPRVVPVAGLDLPSARPSGDARMARRITEDPLRIMGVRPYAPGDSPRFIHWKATARHAALQTKVFEPSAARAAAIFLNLTTVAGYLGTIPDYVEYAIAATASVARYLLDRRESVGLYANSSRRGEAELVRLPPSRRPDRWTEILEALARLVALSSAGYAALLRGETPALPFGANIIAISALVNEEVLAALLDLRSAGHPVTLLAIGEATPTGVPETLDVHWLGGHDAWEKLERIELGPCI